MTVNHIYIYIYIYVYLFKILRFRSLNSYSFFETMLVFRFKLLTFLKFISLNLLTADNHSTPLYSKGWL